MYKKNQLVWVLTSNGRRQKRSHARVGRRDAKQKTTTAKDGGDKDEEDDAADHDDDDEAVDDRGSRTTLFFRARVVSDPGSNPPDDGSSSNNEEPRVLVRYPKGSTYHVRRSYVIPVLETGVVRDRIVVVVPETNEYRRAATVHTCVGESFLEIGCDFGPCVDKVRRALTEVGDVPMHAAGDANTARGTGSNQPVGEDCRVACLGIDKAPESIQIAVDR